MKPFTPRVLLAFLLTLCSGQALFGAKENAKIEPYVANDPNEMKQLRNVEKTAGGEQRLVFSVRTKPGGKDFVLRFLPINPDHCLLNGKRAELAEIMAARAGAGTTFIEQFPSGPGNAGPVETHFYSLYYIMGLPPEKRPKWFKANPEQIAQYEKARKKKKFVP